MKKPLPLSLPLPLCFPLLLALLLALAPPESRAQVTATYVPIPATPGNLLRGDVDLTPRILPGTGFTPYSYLTTRSNFITLNTVTNTVVGATPLPSAAVRGIDPVVSPNGSWVVQLTVGHVSFFDATTAPAGLVATFTNWDTPVSDCDPQYYVEPMFGTLYCLVPYVGSIRVFTLGPGLTVTDFYSIPRSSVGLDAVDPVVLGANCAVPNVVSVDFFNIPTGSFLGTAPISNPPRREIDMVPLSGIGKIYWPLDGAIYRFDPTVPGFTDLIIPVPGVAVEGCDMGVMFNSVYPGGIGAWGVTGFVHIVDLAAGVLLGSAPTPGAVVRNFDPLMTPFNLVGASDGLVYWSVIGTTYAIDVSAPWFPTVAIPTPGGLVDGCDLTASNNLARAVLPHPGFVHVINTITASLVPPGGIISTAGTLRVDVDPLFPTTVVSPPVGSRIALPFLGGLVVLSGFTGAPTQCIVPTLTTVYVLDLATMVVSAAIPIGPLVAGVDPVVVQGATSPFDDNPNTVRDRDQDFLCNRAQMQPYYSRPWFLPWWAIRTPWYRTWGLPGLSQYDYWGRLKLEVLNDQKTVALVDLQGNLIQTYVMPDLIIGGAVYERDWRYCKFYLRNRTEAIFNLWMYNPYLSIYPTVSYVSFATAVWWPPAHDYWNGMEIVVADHGYRLLAVNSISGAIVSSYALPAPCIYPVSMDYKNKLGSVLLRGNLRCIIDLSTYYPTGSVYFNVYPFYQPRLWYPICNTVYDPMNLCALDLAYDYYSGQYVFYASHALTGAYLWHYYLPYRPYGRIFVEKKSKLAKVPLFGGYEYLVNLAPLAWGGLPAPWILALGRPWYYPPVWDYYNRWEVNVHLPNVLTVVDAYRGYLVRTIYTPYPIVGPPVIDPINKYLRVRLQGSYSYFVDLFKLAAGHTPYERLDGYAANLIDEAVFDPNGGLDLAVLSTGQVVVSRSRTGAVLHTVSLPARPIRPLLYDPHNRSAEAILPGGEVMMIDLSEVDDSGSSSPALYPVDLGGAQSYAGVDTFPPPPVNVGGITFGPVGADGYVEVTAPPGSAEPNSAVALVNDSDESVEPAEVNADEFGSFTAHVYARPGDNLCLVSSDVASNVSPPSCLPVNTTVSGVPPDPSVSPPVTILRAPSPNPFHDNLRLAFDVAEAGVVRLQVFDVQGRLVRGLAEEFLVPGSYVREWDGRTADGERAPDGVYFARLTAAGKEFVQRIIRQ